MGWLVQGSLQHVERRSTTDVFASSERSILSRIDMANPQETAMTVATNNEVVLDVQVRDQLVETKVTCPFVGTAVATKNLAVRNDANNPLASIEDVRRLGNSGGGDLGEVLVLFAQGNHAMMRD